MSSKFSEEKMLENITFSIEEYSRKVGEMESEAGAHAGYIAGMTDEEKTAPEVDYVVKTGEALNLDVDTLINADRTSMCPSKLWLLRSVRWTPLLGQGAR